MTVDVDDAVRAIRDADKVELKKCLDQGIEPNDRNKMGWTLLHIACLEGRSEMAEILLDRGASVNACTTDMCTPLHRAASHGNVDSTQVLINKGAYINAQDKNGNTPLHEAAKYLRTNIVKLLIEKKADKLRLNNKKQKFTDVVGQQLMPVVESGDVDTLLQWLDWKLSPSTFGNLNWSVLHHASARGQINIASLLLERGANVNAPDSNKSSALHAACFHGNKRIVELLIGKGANVNAKDQMGNTPLHSAISGAHPDIINILLESGCDTKIPNSEGQIFTHLVNEFLIDAVENRRVAHVSSLLKGQANPDTKDSAGCPLLCVATFKGDLLIADALLESGANPNLPSEDNLKSPLHYTSIWGHFFILKSLLDKGASVSAKDRENRTALHEAARGGFEDMVTVLVGRCSPMDAQDNDGNTPLHLAARWGHTQIVDLLQEKGATDSIKNNDGHIYLDLALMRAVRTEDKSQVMACLAWGGDPNTKDNKGWHLLHHATYKGATEVCRLLIDSEAEINVVDNEERTPLLLAAYRGNQEIMLNLIDSGADINMKDRQHCTPLHWAAAEGSVASVELLLLRGANRNIKNKEGKLYTELLLKHLYFAVRHNDLEKVQCLLRAGADQTAIVRGTDTTPRDEAKRRKNFGILRQMLSVVPKRKIQEDSMAIEFISYLFEEYDSSSEDAASSSDDDGNDQDAYWKMQNATVIVKETDLVEEERKSFWEYWDQKPTIISVKDWCKEDIDKLWEYWEEKSQVTSAHDYFKEDIPWWQRDSESSTDGEDNEPSDQEKYVVISFQDVKKKWGDVISAKEFFKEDECWWRDAVKEIYSSDEDTESGHKVLTMEDAKRKWGSVVSAKEFFREDECWWRDAVEEISDSSERENAINETPMETMAEIKSKWGTVISANDIFDKDYKDWLNSCEDIQNNMTSSEIVSNGKNMEDKALNVEQDLVDAHTKTSTDYKEWDTTSDSGNETNISFSSKNRMHSVNEGKIFISECINSDKETVSEESTSYESNSENSYETEKDIDSIEIDSCSSEVNFLERSTLTNVSSVKSEEDNVMESFQNVFTSHTIPPIDALNGILDNDLYPSNNDSSPVQIALELSVEENRPVAISESISSSKKTNEIDTNDDITIESNFTFYIKHSKDCGKEMVNNSSIRNSSKTENEQKAEINILGQMNTVPLGPLKESETDLNNIPRSAELASTLNIKEKISSISFDPPPIKTSVSSLKCPCKEPSPENNNYTEYLEAYGQKIECKVIPKLENFDIANEKSIRVIECPMRSSEPNIMVSDNTPLILYSALTDNYDDLDSKIRHGKIDNNIAFTRQVDEYQNEQSSGVTSLLSKSTEVQNQPKNIVTEMDECLAKVDASLTLLQTKLAQDCHIHKINSDVSLSNLEKPKMCANFSDDIQTQNTFNSYSVPKSGKQSMVFTKVNVNVPNHLLSKHYNNSDINGTITTSSGRNSSTKVADRDDIEKSTPNLQDCELIGRKLCNKFLTKTRHGLKIHIGDESNPTTQTRGSYTSYTEEHINTAQTLNNEDIPKWNNDESPKIKCGNYPHLKKSKNSEPVDRIKITNVDSSTFLTTHKDSLTDASFNNLCRNNKSKIISKINEEPFCDAGMSTSCTVATHPEDDQHLDIISKDSSQEVKVAFDMHPNVAVPSTLFIIEVTIYLFAFICSFINVLMSVLGINISNK